MKKNEVVQSSQRLYDRQHSGRREVRLESCGEGGNGAAESLESVGEESVDESLEGEEDGVLGGGVLLVGGGGGREEAAVFVDEGGDVGEEGGAGHELGYSLDGEVLGGGEGGRSGRSGRHEEGGRGRGNCVDALRAGLVKGGERGKMREGGDGGIRRSEPR